MDETKNEQNFRGQLEKEEYNREKIKRLIATALGAFIGAFLGSYFIVNQFLTKEYLSCKGYMHNMTPCDTIRPNNFKEHRPMHKPMKHLENNTIYVIMSDEFVKEFPLNIEGIKDRIMKIR